MAGRLGGARVLLLALLVLGVLGMHTLGHPAEGHGAMPAAGHGAVKAAGHHAVGHDPHDAVTVAVDAGAEPGETVAMAAVGTGYAVAVATFGTGHAVAVAGDAARAVAIVGLGVGLDPMSVCLAILTALILLLVLAVTSRLARTADAATLVSPENAGSSRGPPKPRGLLLADLSVLRI
ncbi:hypothetical protein AB0M43_10510 [Longispora sp. NPDC051575]|uniref:hypothetical protein n=1 Tax=Longispora sp. NPDC051575 TaxID=3154943 RepID=UPI00341FB4CC